MPLLSALGSVLPYFASFATLTASVIAMPLFKLNVGPQKPDAQPDTPVLPVVSNVIVVASVSIRPPLVFSVCSSEPA